MTRLFIAGFDTESNSFSPLPTTLADFDLAFGDATRRPLNACSAQLALWRREAEALGWEVHEGLCAVAEPAGPIDAAVYAELRDCLLADLAAAGPDIVLLALHGAALAEDCDDTEGDILERARAIVGARTVIAATLDPHCHLTERMVANANLLVAYKEYPHTDILARAADAFGLARATHERAIHPVMAVWDCRTIGLFPTQAGAMRGFVDDMIAAETRDDRLLSLSLVHGFAHGDVADMGTKMLAVTDGDPAFAQAQAERFGRCVADMGDDARASFVPVADALERVAGWRGARPLILADCGDNPGGGAAGDATFVLRACQERGLRDVAFAMFWDPALVARALRAGVGATVDIEIGGRHGRSSGEPVVLRNASIRGIGHALNQQFAGLEVPIGDAIWLDAQGLHLIVNTRRSQVFDPACLTLLGLDPMRCRAIVVKSANHFQAGFAAIAGGIGHLDSPGSTSPDRPYVPCAP